jgi:hypothetical protein
LVEAPAAATDSTNAATAIAQASVTPTILRKAIISGR